MWLWIVGAIVVLSSVASIAALVGLHQSPRFKRALGENDVPGFLFGAIGVLYGALLAFVVFATWEAYARAETAVTAEAAGLITVFRDTQDFPEPLEVEAQDAIRAYTHYVIDVELAHPETAHQDHTDDALNPVWEIYGQVPITEAYPATLLAGAVARLHDSELRRHLRHLSAEQILPGVFWPVLLLGSIILVLSSFGMNHPNLIGQAAMTGLMAGFLALVLLLIYSLNQPFIGPVPVSSDPFKHAIDQFDALSMEGEHGPMPSGQPSHSMMPMDMPTPTSMAMP
jgi:hypothetical protein